METKNINAAKVFNALFTVETDDGTKPKIAWAKVDAYVMSVGQKTERLKIDGMIHPTKPILPAAVYKKIVVTVHWGKDLKFELLNYKSKVDLSLYSIFGELKKREKQATPPPEQAEAEQTEEIKAAEIDGYTVTMEAAGKYLIVDHDGNEISQETKMGRTLVNKFLKTMI